MKETIVDYVNNIDVDGKRIGVELSETKTVLLKLCTDTWREIMRRKNATAPAAATKIIIEYMFFYNSCHDLQQNAFIATEISSSPVK
tara:strand:- start:2869 stop:3129 length:261 start_codon:yes stop_codon:yes gene_type:complete